MHAQFFEHRKTVFFGHHDVKQDEARSFLKSLFKAFNAVVGSDHLKIVVFQRLFEPRDHFFFVIDH